MWSLIAFGLKGFVYLGKLECPQGLCLGKKHASGAVCAVKPFVGFKMNFKAFSRCRDAVMLGSLKVLIFHGSLGLFKYAPAPTSPVC